MKKILAFAILLTSLCVGAHAQTALLGMKNHTLCTIHVTMYADAPMTGDACFDLIGTAITLAPGTGAEYTDVNAFNAGPGWVVATVPVTSSTPDFNWESVHFTFTGCPTTWGCTPAAGNMGTPAAGCTATVTSWSGGCGGHTVTGNWYSSGGPSLVDVTLDFN